LHRLGESLAVRGQPPAVADAARAGAGDGFDAYLGGCRQGPGGYGNGEGTVGRLEAAAVRADLFFTAGPSDVPVGRTSPTTGLPGGVGFTTSASFLHAGSPSARAASSVTTKFFMDCMVWGSDAKVGQGRKKRLDKSDICRPGRDAPPNFSRPGGHRAKNFHCAL
jgi:hypothetical protein